MREITTMTLWRWRQRPEFQQTLNSVSYSGLDELAQKMNIAALTAAEVLQESLCDMREPADFRLKAALGTLKVMPAINAALEQSLQHRAADFDTRKQFSGPPLTYGSDGRSCQLPAAANEEIVPEEVEV